MQAPDGSLTYNCSSSTRDVPMPAVVKANPKDWDLVELDKKAVWHSKTTGAFIWPDGKIAGSTKSTIITSRFNAPTIEYPLGDELKTGAKGEAGDAGTPGPSGYLPELLARGKQKSEKTDWSSILNLLPDIKASSKPAKETKKAQLPQQDNTVLYAVGGGVVLTAVLIFAWVAGKGR